MHDVVVIGAGASGLGAAIRLKQQGITDFVVLEKADDLGGTWRDNTYPGCACDVPSALYSYSFAPNPSWSRAFAEQPEILAYLRRTAAAHGVQVRFGTEVLRVQWSSDHWELETSAGPVHARAVVAGTGPWHEPSIPSLPGLAGFDGEVFHSSRWNHSYDLRGKRVAVVGTGASAVQFVPRIQPLVSELHVFQRTAQWVLPKPDHYVPPAERWLMRRVPAVQRALRAAEYGGMEALGLGFRHPWVLRRIQYAGSLHLRRAVQDPVLRAALTPDYTLGCKRLLMSNTYYPALVAPNVRVRPALRSVTSTGVVGADGSVTDVDAIIFGTGFRILDMPVMTRVFSSSGQSLADVWSGSPSAYLGTTVAGFPNLFLLLGPNLGTGHTSAFVILEAQLAHTVSAISALLRNGWNVAPRPAVQDAYNAKVQAALTSTVYETGGCTSYYHDENGHNSFSWPWSSGRLRRRVSRFDPADYLVESPVSAGAQSSAGAQFSAGAR